MLCTVSKTVFLLCVLVNVSIALDHPKNGAEDHKAWIRPCKGHKVAKKGTLYLNGSADIEHVSKIC